MRRRLLVGVLVAGFVASGCQSSGVDAADSSTPSPTGSPSHSAPVAPTPSSTTAPAQLLAVGDVGDCAPRGDRGRASAKLARRLDGPVLLLGDIAYPDGSRGTYDRCFWPAWEPLRERVRAVIGNHDDRSRATFFATWPRAGTSARPWYAFDEGSWRILVVEGNCTVTGCGATAPQTRWLTRQLAANVDRCTAVALHQPRFSSDDEHGDDRDIDPLWRAAYRGGVDLVLAAHAHDYERIGPVGLRGRPNLDGPVLFVTGTGGAHLRGFADVTPASKVRIADTFGLLRLSLADGSWRAAFLAAPSGKVRDQAAGTCR